MKGSMGLKKEKGRKQEGETEAHEGNEKISLVMIHSNT